MKTLIQVKDRAEARAITLALGCTLVRAFVVTCGILDALPTERARLRVMQFVQDKLAEQDAAR